MTSTDSTTASSGRCARNAAAPGFRHRRRWQRHQGRNRRPGHRPTGRRPVQAADPQAGHAVGSRQDDRRRRQRIRLDRPARGDLSRRRHPRHRPDRGQRRQVVDRHQRPRHHQRRTERPGGRGAQRRRRGRAGRRALRGGQGHHRRGGAAHIRNRNRVGGHSQRDIAAQYRVRPSRGRRQRSRTPRRVVGPGQAAAGATKSGRSR